MRRFAGYGVEPAIQERIRDLGERKEFLSEAEHAELLSLIEFCEHRTIERLEAEAALRQLRQFVPLDDDAASLVIKAAQLKNQPLEHWMQENICEAAARAVSTEKPAFPRVSPLHPGSMQPAPDFNAPLEEFTPYL